MKTLLQLDLVPKTAWYSNLRRHLLPEEWKKLQQQTFGPAQYRCEICHGVGPKHPVECHEEWDYQTILQNGQTKNIQTLRRCWSLCPACHQVKHYGLAQIQGYGKKAYEWLKHVNQWDNIQADAHIQQSFTIWQRRSMVPWTLDLNASIAKIGWAPKCFKNQTQPG